MACRVQLTPAFVARLKALVPGRRTAAISGLRLFMRKPNDITLKLRPLKSIDGYWIINSSRGDRIILRREADDLYAAVDVGGHEVYERWDR